MRIRPGSRAPALSPEAAAAKSCAQCSSYPSELAGVHFDALKEILDEAKPSHRQ